MLCVFGHLAEDQAAPPMSRPSPGPYQCSGRRKIHTKKKKGTINANMAGTKYEIGMTPAIQFLSETSEYILTWMELAFL